MLKNLTKSEILTVIAEAVGTAVLGALVGLSSAAANKREIDEQVEKRLAELQAPVEYPDEI